MTLGIEVWQVWQTAERDRVLILLEGLQPPFVEGSEALRAKVLEVYFSFAQESGLRLFPDLLRYMQEALADLGWQLIGHTRVENLAGLHLQAAVHQTEQSAVEQRKSQLVGIEESRRASDSESVRAESAIEKQKRLINQLTNQILSASAMGKAMEASRTAVILSVAALEAFINDAAREIEWWSEDEDMLSLKRKWTIVPSLLSGGSTFDRGAQPFQDFHLLVKLRDSLVHAKPSEKFFEGPDALMKAYTARSSLDVTPEEGRKACITARKMIMEFCRITNRQAPEWCAYVPLVDLNDLDTWSSAVLTTGLRPDPDFPPTSGPQIVSSTP